MIKANFNAYSTYVTDSLYQWDLNQVLSVTGLNLSVVPEVHFSNANMDKAIVRQASMENHVVSVGIPNSLLQDPLMINAHIGIYEGSTFKIVEKVEIPVIAKERPVDYRIEDADEEIHSFKALENALKNKADSARVDNIITHNNDTDGNTELVDIRVGARGKCYNSAGTAIREQFLSISLPAAAIEPDDDLDLNNYTAPANYVFAVTSDIVNLPDHFINGADIPRYLVVECFGERIESLNGIQTWGRQIVYTKDGDKAYQRFFNYDYTSGDFLFTLWKSVTYYNNHRTLTGSPDLNTIVEPDSYIVATTTAENTPFTWAGFLLEVKETSHGWLIQIVHGLHNNPCEYYRIGNNPGGGMFSNGDPNLAVIWSEWQRNVTSTELAQIQRVNSGQVVINMGDSLTGNTQDDTSISAELSRFSGAETHNFGFGGCRMSAHIGPWAAFSMHALADAIATGNFSVQETAATNSEVPDYFVNTVAAMQAIDFSSVDIMTIAYGVNDYTAGKGLDNPNDAYDTDYYAGALRYSIERILTAYPNIRPVIVTPAWCFWPTSTGTVERDSDTRYFNAEQNTLPDFVRVCLEVGEKYHLPVVNAYTGMAINKFNCSSMFNSGDGIHHNAAGRRTMAKLIANTLGGM